MCLRADARRRAARSARAAAVRRPAGARVLSICATAAARPPACGHARGARAAAPAGGGGNFSASTPRVTPCCPVQCARSLPKWSPPPNALHRALSARPMPPRPPVHPPARPPAWQEPPPGRPGCGAERASSVRAPARPHARRCAAPLPLGAPAGRAASAPRATPHCPPPLPPPCTPRLLPPYGDPRRLANGSRCAQHARTSGPPLQRGAAPSCTGPRLLRSPPLTLYGVPALYYYLIKEASPQQTRPVHRPFFGAGRSRPAALEPPAPPRRRRPRSNRGAHPVCAGVWRL
jgi:hypothetical protein